MNRYTFTVFGKIIAVQRKKSFEDFIEEALNLKIYSALPAFLNKKTLTSKLGKGKYLLHIALESNDQKLLELIIEKVASLKIEKEVYLDLRNKEGKNLLELLLEKQKLSMKELKILNLLLTPDRLKNKLTNGQYPIHICLKNNNQDLLGLISEKIEQFKLKVEVFKNQKTSEGKSVLDLILEKKKITKVELKILDYLIEGSELKAKVKNGKYFVHFALEQGNVGFLKMIERKALKANIRLKDIYALKTDKNQTCLDIGIFKEDIDCLEYVLEYQDMETLLNLYPKLKMKLRPVVKERIRKLFGGLADELFKNPQKMTKVSLKLMNCCIELFQIQLNLKYENKSFLHFLVDLAAQRKFEFKYLRKILDKFKLFELESLKDNVGDLFIHTAAKYVNLELTSYLLGRGFLAVYTNGKGQNVLDVVIEEKKNARSEKDFEVIEKILKRQIDHFNKLWQPDNNLKLEVTDEYICIGEIRLARNMSFHKLNGDVKKVSKKQLTDEIFVPGKESALFPLKTTMQILKFLALSVKINKPALLIGETATGKTSVIRWLAHLLNIPYRRMNFSKQTEKNELIGTWKYVVYEDEKGKHKKTITWQDAILIQAMRKGHWLLLDEVNLASAGVLGRLNALFNRPNLFVVHEEGHYEQIKIHPNFRLFGAMNPPEYSGRNQLSADFLNRFAVKYVDNFTKVDLQRILIEKYSLNKKLAQSLVGFHMELRDLVEKKELGANEVEKYEFSLRTLLRLVKRLQKIAESKTTSMDKLTVDIEIIGEIAEIYSDMFRHHQDHKLFYETLQKYFPGEYLKKYLSQELKRAYKLCLSETHIEIEGVKLKKINNPILRDKNFDLIPIRTTCRWLYKIAKSLLFKENILLTGPTASGKTSIVMWLGQMMGVNVDLISIDQQTDVADLIGQYIEKPGKDGKTRIIVFEKGKLLKAIENGNWVILDEINLAKTEIIERLNSLLDDDRMIVISETGELMPVKVHENFRLFCTMNPPGKYQGRKSLSKAMRNKFTEIFIDDIFKLDELDYILKCYLKENLREHTGFVIKVFSQMNEYFRQNYPDGTEEGLGYLTLRDLKLVAKYLNDLYSYKKEIDNKDLLRCLKFCFVDRYPQEDIRKKFFSFWQQKAVNEILLEEKFFSVKKSLTQSFETVMIGNVGLPVRNLGSMSDYDKAFIPDKSAKLYPLPKTMQIMRDLAMAVRLKKPLVLIGETAGGKTAMIRDLAHRTNSPFRRMNFSKMTEKSELIGSWQIRIKGKKQCIEWIDGILIEAMIKGHWLLLDEVNLAPAALLGRLNALFNAPEMFLVHEDGHEEKVKVHPDFRLFAAMNKNKDVGRQALSYDFLNRFLAREVSELGKSELRIILEKHYGLSKQLSRKLVGFHLDIKSRVEDDEFGFEQREKYVYSLRTLQRLVQRLLFYCKRNSIDPNKLKMNEIVIAELMQMYSDMLRSEKDKRDFISILNDHFGTPMVDKAYQNEQKMEYKFTGFKAKEKSLKVADVEFPKFKQVDYKKIKDAIDLIPVRTTRRYAHRILKSILMNEHLLLTGPTASGKTSLIQWLAQSLGIEVEVISIDGETEISDLIGQYVQKKGDKGQMEYVFEKGKLLKAMEQGKWIVLDEVNLAKPEVLERLNSLLDDDRMIVVTESGEKMPVKSHKNFRLFCTMNPFGKYYGRKKLSKPMRNKFTEIYVEEIQTVPELAKISSELLNQELQKYAMPLAKIYCEFNTFLGLEQENNDDPGFGVNTLRNLRRVIDYMNKFLKGMGMEKVFAYGMKFALCDHFAQEEIRKEFEKILVKVYPEALKELNPVAAKTDNADLKDTDLRTSIRMDQVKGLWDLLLFILERSDLEDNENIQIRKWIKVIGDTDILSLVTTIDQIKNKNLKQRFIDIFVKFTLPKIDTIFPKNFESDECGYRIRKHNRSKLFYFLATWDVDIEVMRDAYSKTELNYGSSFFSQLVSLIEDYPINKLSLDVIDFVKKSKLEALVKEEPLSILRQIKWGSGIMKKLDLVRLKDLDLDSKTGNLNVTIYVGDGVSLGRQFTIKLFPKLDSGYKKVQSNWDNMLFLLDFADEKIYKKYIKPFAAGFDYDRNVSFWLASAIVERNYPFVDNDFLRNFFPKDFLPRGSWKEDQQKPLQVVKLMLENNSAKAMKMVEDSYATYASKMLIRRYPKYIPDVFGHKNEAMCWDGVKSDIAYSEDTYNALAEDLVLFDKYLKVAYGYCIKGYSKSMRTFWFFRAIKTIVIHNSKNLQQTDKFLECFEKYLIQLVLKKDLDISTVIETYVDLNRIEMLKKLLQKLPKKYSELWLKRLSIFELSSKENKKSGSLGKVFEKLNWDILDQEDDVILEEILMMEEEDAEKRLQIFEKKVKVGKYSIPIKKVNKDFEFLIPGKETRLYPLKNTIETIEDIVASIALNLPFLLIGNTACGKTAMIRWLAHLTQIPLVRINLSKQTDKAELIGSWQMVKTESEKGQIRIEWVPSLLVKAMQKGFWALLDEINLASADVLGRLNNLFGAKKVFIVHESGKDEGIKIHPDFRLFATMNKYSEIGRKPLSRDFLNRFVHRGVPDFSQEDLQIILSSYYNLPSRIVPTLVEFHNNMIQLGELEDIGLEEREKYIFSFRTIKRLVKRIETIAKLKIGKGGIKNLEDAMQEVKLEHRIVREIIHVYGSMLRTGYDRDIFNQHLRLFFGKEIIDKCLQKDSSVKHILSKIKCNGLDFLKLGDVSYPINSNFSSKLTTSIDLIPTKTTLSWAYKILKSLKNKEHVNLTGPTAASKTSLVMWLGKLVGTPVEVISLDENTDVSDLLGQYIITKGSDSEKPKVIFSNGKLIEAMEKGYWIVLDEINLALTEIIERLNSLLDDNRVIVLSENGKQKPIKCHKNFRLITTMNPAGKYVGRKVLADAMRNKFTEIFISGEFTEVDLRQIAGGFLYAKNKGVGVKHDSL